MPTWDQLDYIYNSPAFFQEQIRLPRDIEALMPRGSREAQTIRQRQSVAPPPGEMDWSQLNTTTPLTSKEFLVDAPKMKQETMSLWKKEFPKKSEAELDDLFKEVYPQVWTAVDLQQRGGPKFVQKVHQIMGDKNVRIPQPRNTYERRTAPAYGWVNPAQPSVANIGKIGTDTPDDFLDTLRHETAHGRQYGPEFNELVKNPRTGDYEPGPVGQALESEYIKRKKTGFPVGATHPYFLDEALAYIAESDQPIDYDQIVKRIRYESAKKNRGLIPAIFGMSGHDSTKLRKQLEYLLEGKQK